MQILTYCKKCGRRVIRFEWDKEWKCDCCNATTYPIPEEYWLDGLKFLFNSKLEEKFYEEIVKTSPEFDQYLFDHREEILAQKSAEFQAVMAHGRAVMENTAAFTLSALF